MPAFALRCAALHTPAPDRLEYWSDARIDIDAGGRIAAIRDANDGDNDAVTLGTGKILLPGLVDLHIHAPQWPQLGTALDPPLERWLLDYTFPLEARYADVGFAARVYDRMVPALLANGTTTAVYFASRHLEATQILADACLRHGQRALVGRVAMDHPEQCPDFYRDASAEAAVADTRALIDFIRAMPRNAGLVLPVITPRFVPACTDDLLRGLGALAAECGCHVQTHVSESDWEHGHVLERCGCSDADALANFGLIGRRTVLAHGNFLDAADLSLIRAHGGGIAHCPLSNAYFANAVFPLRAVLDKQVRVGLGTDIAGGPSASLLDSARMAVTVARMLESGVEPSLPAEQRGSPGARIDTIAAFFLATAGGGDVLDLPIGRFAPEQQFDAVLLDPEAPGGNFSPDPDDAPERLLERIVHTASRANISRVWVGGRVVHRSAREQVITDIDT
jgi:guanine deaminase